jgi:hypothetical protein
MPADGLAAPAIHRVSPPRHRPHPAIRSLGILSLLAALIFLAPTAHAGPGQGEKEQDCWKLMNTISGVEHIDTLARRGRAWRDIAPFVREVEQNVRRELPHLFGPSGNAPTAGLALPQTPHEWFSPSRRERLSKALRGTSERLNCSQFVSGRVRVTSQRDKGIRTTRAKSLLPPGFLEDYATSLMLFLASLLAGIGIIVREMMERRRHRRYLVSAHATLRISGRESGVMLRDISRGGTRIAYPDHLPVKKGQRVTIIIEDLTITGRIAWAAGGMAGIAFDHAISLPGELIARSRAIV